MNKSVSRRTVLCFLTSMSLFPWTIGCEQIRSGARKTKLIVVAVGKRVFKIFSVGIDMYELTVEIKAILDGKEETIEVSITKEQAEALENGGRLIIKDERGEEFPVEYRTK